MAKESQLSELSALTARLKPELAEGRGVVAMTPKEAIEFGSRLASDDDFRARLVENPFETLAEYHIYLPPRSLDRPVTLPTKEEAQEVLQALALGRELRFAGLAMDAVPPQVIFMFFIVFAVAPAERK